MLDDDARATDDLFPLVYEELRGHARLLMQNERVGHTLQATAVVNELYLTLGQQTRAKWQSQAHFKAVAAFAMRRLLQQHARAATRKKRGGGAWNRIALHEDAATFTPEPDLDVEALDHALQQLGKLRERTVRVVEMKFFAGMNNDEIAEALGTSTRTVDRDWRFARAWLLTELAE